MKIWQKIFNDLKAIDGVEIELEVLRRLRFYGL